MTFYNLLLSHNGQELHFLTKIMAVGVTGVPELQFIKAKLNNSRKYEIINPN